MLQHHFPNLVLSLWKKYFIIIRVFLRIRSEKEKIENAAVALERIRAISEVLNHPAFRGEYPTLS